MSDASSGERVRLDKWLWAARFFRTRNLAKQAVEGGHVRYDGERVKVSKDVQTAAKLTIRQGYDEIEVLVLGLSDQRAGAPIARLLYQETVESQARREQAAMLRRIAGEANNDARPTKKQRRALQRLKRQ